MFDKTQHDIKLFAELYDVHPQAIVWLPPVWSQDGLTILDFEFAYCNDEGLKYLNLTREQQKQGLRISNSPTITDELRHKVMIEMVRIYETGEKSETNIFNPVLNKYARVLRTKLRGGILSIMQDRTEENETIRQLEQQKHLLDNVLQYSSSGITVGEVIRDKNGSVVDERTVLVNDAAVKFTGIPKDIYLSKTAGEIDPGYIHSAYFKMGQKTLETGAPFITQYRLEPTGRWLEVSASRMDEDRLIYIFTDVTSIKEAHLAIERSANQLQTIINRTQSGIFTITPVFDELKAITDFRFVIANKALAAYVHQEPEQLIGELGSKYFTGYKTNGLFELFKETFETGKMNRFDFHYYADGIDAWIDMMCTSFDGEVLVTFTEYTRVKKLQIELEKTVEELVRSNKSLEEFTYAASHDLKEPVRKIIFFSERLQQHLSAIQDKEGATLLSRIEKASHRMGLLLDDLLEYSQLGQGINKIETVDLSQKVRNVLEDLELAIQEKAATIQVGKLPAIKGNRRQLQQLFQNLISNALKYSKADELPLIKITANVVTEGGLFIEMPAMGQNYYLIKVQDNGIGFEQEDAERIFNVFTRLHGKGEYSGTGVGLSIVRKVVENHKGFVWADSKPGVGTTFNVALPSV